MAVSAQTETVEAEKPDPLADRKIYIDESRIGIVRMNGGYQFPLFMPEFDFETLADQGKFGQGERAKRIAAWYKEGTAAGNVGDVYENRDRGHSRLNVRQFGQIAVIDYPEELKAMNVHVSAKYRFAHQRPAIVNASMALTGRETARSLPRLMLHDPAIAARLYPLYRMNDLCFYPEHHDHDPKDGDVFAINTPYLIVSQGSSGSDRPFMGAAAQTLASFRPDVKKKLADNGFLASTVQMIMRWCYADVGDAERYLSGAAHPVVFDGKKLRPEAMVDMAHGIEIGSLPPLAMIEVIDEDLPKAGLEFHGPEMSEALLTTPCAIGRIARNLNFERTFVVSAEPSVDLNGKPLTYHWKVLRGDPARITIEPLDSSESLVRITVEYQPESYPVGAEGLPASRVDIGAFVHNGDYFSPPAFISIWYPPNEKREYDLNGRLMRVEYLNPKNVGPRADPFLAFDLSWSDEYAYDDAGNLLGWERTSRDGFSDWRFNAKGELLRSNASWDSSRARPVSYDLSPLSNGVRTVSWD